MVCEDHRFPWFSSSYQELKEMKDKKKIKWMLSRPSKRRCGFLCSWALRVDVVGVG